MHSLSLFAAAASIASAAVLDTRQTTSSANCAKSLHVLAVGGGNSNDPSSIGKLGTLAMAITSKIPGSDYVSVPYNKVDVSMNTLSPTAIPEGIVTFSQYVSQYMASCPNTKMAFIGYSSGADIMLNAIRQNSVPMSLAGKQVVAVVAYGEETFVPGTPYDRGTCKMDGKHPASPTALGAYIPITESYSDMNDPQSCSGPPQDYEIHLAYPKYDGVASDFVVSQYNKLGNGAVVGSSTSSSSMSSSSSSSSANAFFGAASTTTSAIGSAITVTSNTNPVSTAAFASATNSAAAIVTSTVSGMMSSAMASSMGPAATSIAPFVAGSAGNSLSPSLLSTVAVGAMVLLGAALF